jgi:hypothetical protein
MTTAMLVLEPIFEADLPGAVLDHGPEVVELIGACYI